MIISPNMAIEFLDYWDQEEYEIIKQKWKDIPKELFSNG